MTTATKHNPVEREIEWLRGEIRHHEHLYYVLDQTEIADADFDALMNQVKKLEAQHPELITPDSPSQRVGGQPPGGFTEIQNSAPMLPLDNAYIQEELSAW